MRNRMLWFSLLLLLALPLWAQTGRIEGTVTRDSGSGVGGVTVVLNETGAVKITRNDGTYTFDGVAPGSYTVSFSLGDNATTEEAEVAAGEATTVDLEVDWDVSFAETITVYSASRRQERIVDAPAAVSVFTEEDIAAEVSTGQLAKVLEFSPGVEVTQSGIYDFNLNTRGFNSSLNRRVQTLVDGRDPAVPFLGSTEWAFLGNLQDLASVELVRGPSSALYGANAFNGVLNMVTKSPRDTLGGKATITAGDQDTLRFDFGASGELGAGLYGKFTGGYTEGTDFTRDRRTSTEYPGLPPELAAPSDEYDNFNFALRFDKHFEAGSILTLEGGQFEGEGSTTVTGIGRVNVGDVKRPWARANFSTQHFNLLGYYNGRESPNQLALASANRIFLDTQNRHIEGQTNWDFADGKVRLVAGASYEEEEIDTANTQGAQTLVFAPVEHDFTAFFAQLDFELTDDLKLVLAGRSDDSSLYDNQFSPKAALVWSINPNNTLRFSYNEAFQVANYSEFFLDAPTVIPGVGPSIDLSGIEAALCAPFGITCGFGSPTQVRALGNKDLQLEEITSFELGYSGILGSKGYLTVDYYVNELENFITDLTANPFGTVNPNFGPYQPPAGHPLASTLVATLQGALGPAFVFLSNNVDGTPIFALASYTNAGAVDTQGIDIGLNYYISQRWLFDFSYSWFDFDIKQQSLGEDPLPNAPENKFSLGITYNGDNFGASAKFRWVDDFEWAAGAFAGPVPSYEVLNLAGHYDVNDVVTIGLNISNALDDEHYESFGGDLLERRALGYITLNW